MSSARPSSTGASASEKTPLELTRETMREYRKASKDLASVEDDVAKQRQKTTDENAKRLKEVTEYITTQKKALDNKLKRATSAVSSARSSLSTNSIAVAPSLPGSYAANSSQDAAAELTRLAEQCEQMQNDVRSAVSDYQAAKREKEDDFPGVTRAITILTLLLAGVFIASTIGFMASGGDPNLSISSAGMFPFLVGSIALLVTSIGVLNRQLWAVVLLLIQYLTPLLMAIILGINPGVFLSVPITQFFGLWIGLDAGINYFAPGVVVVSVIIGLVGAFCLLPARSIFTSSIRLNASAQRASTSYSELALVAQFAETTHARALAKVNETATTRRNAATTQNNADSNATQTQTQQRLDTANQQFQSTLADLRQRTRDTFTREGFSLTYWDNVAWNRWAPARQIASPRHARFAAITDAGGAAKPSHEALIPQDNSAPLPLTLERALLFESVGDAKQRAGAALQALTLRLLATLPPGMAYCTFIDPIGLGQGVAALMSLGKIDKDLITGKAWTEPQHIEQRLQDLTERVETIIQSNLRDKYPDIETYNARNGEIAERYHILVVLDFPANFTDVAARRLLSLVSNGPRCGVYPLILRDTGIALPHNFQIDALQNACLRLALDNGVYSIQDDDFRVNSFSLDALPSSQRSEHILETIGPRAIDARHVVIPFERIAPTSVNDWWQDHAMMGLDVPIGLTEDQRQQKFHVDEETRVNALVVGQPGSGKSSMLHTLITNLALRDDPDDVRLYLVDMKEGVEFEGFARRRLPHARVIAIDSEREFALSVLREVAKELERRGDLFNTVHVRDLSTYRQQTGEKLPRILLVIDEFQRLFEEDDALANEALLLLDQLVRLGRSFGIHLVLSTQSLDGQRRLARSTKDLIQVRIVFQSSDADSRLALADDNGAARLLTRPGEAIYNDLLGRVDHNHQLQVAYLPPPDQDRYLDQLRDRANREGRVYDQFIFDGSRPSELSENADLRNLEAAVGWPTTAYPLPVWLGEPVEIRPSIAATFRRQSGSNLLIVGQQPQRAMGVVSAALISAATQLAPNEPATTTAPLDPFYILDFNPAESDIANRLEQIAAYLPQKAVVARPRHLTEVVKTLASAIDARLQATQSGDNTITWRPTLFILFGAQSARDIRPDDLGGGSSFSPSTFSMLNDTSSAPPQLSPTQMFSHILRDGPEVGVHTIVWCDNMNNLNRALERGALRDFALRVTFRAPRDDSHALINSPAAETLHPLRALLYDDDQNLLTKFRPYSAPDDSWLTQWSERLRQRK